MSERLPADYYVLPEARKTLPGQLIRTIETALNGHKYWFIEDYTASAGPTGGIWYEAAEWCEDQFGVPASRWSFYFSETKFCYFTFSSAGDALVFRMRWC